jgi:uncharacterized protein YbjT (DUF2867 family)
MILLTGATGKTGGVVARALAAQGLPVRALVRSPAKAAALAEAGVQLVVADLADAAAVRAAMDGVEKALLLLPNGREQLALERQFVAQACAGGVRHLVKISSMEAVPEAASPIPRVHYASEQHIKGSGLDWTMIRPNFYMQNFLGSAATIRSQGRIYLPVGKGQVPLTDTRDVAAVIAHVLATPGHAGRSYEITGPELLDFAQAARIVGETLGRPVEYVDMDPAEYRKVLAPYVSSEWHLDAVMELFAEIAAGQSVYVTSTFRELVGREPTSLAQFVRDHAAVFGG